MTDDDQAWGRMLALHSRVEQELAKALQRRHGLGLSEYRALGRLIEAPGFCLRMQELADAIGLNQSSVSRLIGRLEDAGLTERDLCEKDRRGVYSLITEAGRKRHAEAAPTYQDILAAELDKAAADPDLAGAVAAVRRG